MQAVSLHTKDTYDATLNAVLIKKISKSLLNIRVKKKKLSVHQTIQLFYKKFNL